MMMGPGTRERSADHRFRAVLLAGALLLAPPIAFRLTCVGRTCAASAAPVTVPAPFCSLPVEVRRLVAAGFREGRSPDVLAVAGDDGVSGGSGPYGNLSVPWPSTASDTRAPIVFSGDGIHPGIRVGSRTGLDDIAPTIADVLGFRPPFPHVRAGRVIPRVATGPTPRLIVEVAWVGVGPTDLQGEPQAWPNLRELLHQGAGTTQGQVGSLPLDPAAILTTIGTGGLPSQHGITGTLLRNANGKLVRAWGSDAPGSVIATLPDDFDEAMHQRPLVGVVEQSSADRGIVGGTWYPNHDQDFITRAASPGGAARQAAGLLAKGFGADATPDILAVVMRGSVAQLDRRLGELVHAARRVTPQTAFVVAGTGSIGSKAALTGADVVQGTEATTGRLVEAAVPGGLFLDQSALEAVGATGSGVRNALAELNDATGVPIMADAFQSYAVSFGRYC